MKTNLLLIPFNRPHYLEKVLNAIDVSDFDNVLAFIDGPRNAEDRKQIKKVVALLKNHGIKNINAQSKNIGINNAFESALDWFFSTVESGVILEEDCIPDRSFFKFASKMFKSYKNDTRVGMVSGFNPAPSHQDNYFFSHNFGIWGWGTWRDRWQTYRRITKSSDIKLSYWYLLRQTRSIFGALMLYTKFQRQLRKGQAFWDINWVYTNFLLDRVTIMPAKNLITNIGHFGNSSHKKTSLHDTKTETIKTINIKKRSITISYWYDFVNDLRFNMLPSIKTWLYQLFINKIAS